MNKIYINKGIYDNKDIFENTLESIKKAISLKRGLYLTVRETRDHTLIIYEDSNLSRLQNLKDKISDIFYEDLSYLSFYHIPTLKEVLELTPKVPIILDLKMKPHNKEIYEMINNYQGEYILISNHKVIHQINQKYPNLKIGEIITKKRKFSLLNFMIKTDYYSYDLNYYDPLELKKLKEDKKPIIAYTINNQIKYNEFKDEFDYLVIDNYKNIKLDK